MTKHFNLGDDCRPEAMCDQIANLEDMVSSPSQTTCPACVAEMKKDDANRIKMRKSVDKKFAKWAKVRTKLATLLTKHPDCLLYNYRCKGEMLERVTVQTVHRGFGYNKKKVLFLEFGDGITEEESIWLNSGWFVK